jgi:ATP-dependent helicase/nuclease subunit A
LKQARELSLEPRAAAPHPVLELAPDELRRRVAESRARLEERAFPSFRHVSVTDVAKHAPEGPGVEPPEEGPARDTATRFRGYSWGSAVHGALAAAAADDSELALRSACRALLVENGRPLDDHGEPRELEELVALVRAVRGSELWRRAAAAGRAYAEVPFAAPGVTRPPPRPIPEPEPEGGRSGRGLRQLDLFGGASPPSGVDAPEPGDVEEDASVPSVLEGVVDLAFREKGGWVIADYKTDVGTDPDFPARLEAYRRQVDLYAEAWARLTGEPVKERVLFFTAQGRIESW